MLHKYRWPNCSTANGANTGTVGPKDTVPYPEKRSYPDSKPGTVACNVLYPKIWAAGSPYCSTDPTEESSSKTDPTTWSPPARRWSARILPSGLKLFGRNSSSEMLASARMFAIDYRTWENMQIRGATDRLAILSDQEVRTSISLTVNSLFRRSKSMKCVYDVK